MNSEQSPIAWSGVSKTFHWIVALCIVVAVALGLLAESAQMSPGKLQLFIWHKSMGITVLALMILRLSWRALHRAPDELAELSSIQRRMARLGHAALYCIALLMPLSGWVLNSAANFPFKWFGVVAVPMLIEPDKAIQSNVAIAHSALAWVLVVLVLGHLLMAFKHHRAGLAVLQRMLPGQLGPLMTISALMLTAAAWVVLVWKSSYLATAEEGLAIERLNAAPSYIAEKRIDSVNRATDWVLIADQSYLGFIGLYDDVEFEGRFKHFEPNIRFDPENLSQARFDVVINTASTDTDSADRDEMLPEEDWFHVQAFPRAHYRAERFEIVGGDSYRALGILELKGRTKEVPLNFSWVHTGDTAVLEGEAAINRQDFGIGAGYWADDSTVGFEVKVKTYLKLRKPMSQ